MSINKYIKFFTKNKPFFWVSRLENSGFWIFELLVSIVILMLISLFLFRFSCNMISLEADSISRLMAIDYIASRLDGASSKNMAFGQGMTNPGGKNINFELKSQVSSINIVKSNLPESVKNPKLGVGIGVGASSFVISCVSVSYKSAFGKENIVKIFASAPNAGGVA